MVEKLTTLKALKLYRIKLLMSLLVLGLFALYLILTTIIRIQKEEARYLELTRERLTHDLSDMAGRFEQDLTLHQALEIRRHILIYGARRRVLAMALTAPKTDRILAASQFDLEGRFARDELLHFEPRIARATITSGTAQIVRFRGYRHLHAYFPVKLANEIGSGSSDQSKALLYLLYDLGPGLDEIFTRHLAEGSEEMIALLLCMIILQLALKRWVHDPVSRLSTIANEITREQPGKQIVYSGNGELSSVIDAFNAMSRSIAETLDALRIEKQNLEAMLLSIGDAVIVTDKQGHIARMNATAERLSGLTLSEVAGQSFDNVFRIIDNESGLVIPSPIEEVLTSRRIVSLNGQIGIASRDGRTTPISDTAAPIIDQNDQMLGVILVFQNVSEQFQLRNALVQAHKRLSDFCKALPDIAFILNSEGRYIDIFGVNTRLLFAPPESLIGKRVTDVLPTNVSEQVMHVIHKTLETGEPQSLIYSLDVLAGLRHFEARTAPMSEDEVAWISVDITERKLAEEEIEYLAFYDPLTQLPNRRLMLEHLAQALVHGQRNHQFGALLFLDLDHLKNINDSLGHTIGDQVILLVAERIRSLLRTGDMVSRLGGDEFVVILTELSGDNSTAISQALRVSEKIRETLGQPFTLEGHEYVVTSSIGITMFPAEEDQTPEIVVQQADTAMYRAKDAGRNAVQVYHPNMQAIVDFRLALEEELRKAVNADELRPHFQPQFNEKGQLIGAEVLARWHHAERGWVPPDQFIGIAESCGLIHRIGTRILELTCMQIREWDRHLRLELPHISVNISSRQFRSNAFVKGILDILESHDMPRDRLTLEITEGLVIENIDDAIDKMQQLREHGLRFSLDDFGIGYSSLSYLKRLPLDEIKIDKSFVLDILQDANDTVIVDTIIAMTRHLQLEVIAEGVENRAQFEFLQEKGCRRFQGYYFSAPLPADAFAEKYLKR